MRPRLGFSPARCLIAVLLLQGCSSSREPEAAGPCTQFAGGRLLCGDFGHTLGTTEELLIVGRALTEEPGFDLESNTPRHDLSQEELPDIELRLLVSDPGGARVGEFYARTDDEGWIAERLDLSDLRLEPGAYRIDVFTAGAWLSSLRARLLPPDYAGELVISDIDLTYLDTDFQSTKAAAALLDETPGEKLPLPAMPIVYRELRAGSDGDADRPLTFLSGSPLFFRRVLQSRMDLDRIADDGIALKPIQLLLMHELLDGFEVDELLAAFAGDIGALLGSVDDQLGFKLTALFAQQLNLPSGTRLLLLGDDSEMDHVTYALFHRTLSGELTLDALLERLDELSVDSFWRDAIERVAPSAIASRSPVASPVDAIFINLTAVPNDDEPASDWVVPGLSRHHRGAWPLVLELREVSAVRADARESVREELLAQGRSDDELEVAAAEAVAGGFLRED